MKHINSISRNPSQASIVETDALFGVLGRAITALTASFNFILYLVGFPDQIDKIKGNNA